MTIYEGIKSNPLHRIGYVIDPNVSTARSDISCEGIPVSMIEDNAPKSPIKYKVVGRVTENTLPVQRTVRLYRFSTGELLDETESSTSGNYELVTRYNDKHYVVCLAPYDANSYNHLIRKDVEVVNI